MELSSRYAWNGNVKIHYLESSTESKFTPIVICPGLSETAEEYTDLIAYLYPRRCIALSFRGRDVITVDFKHSAHDIRSTEKEGLYLAIRQFVGPRN